MATKKPKAGALPAAPAFALREEFIAAVRASLSRKGYHPQDFRVSQSVEGGHVRLDVVYEFANDFWLVAWVRAEEDEDPIHPEPVGSINGTSVPGSLLREERFGCKNKTELLAAVGAWVQRLDAELRAIPVNREVAEQRELVEKLTRELGEQSDKAFTRDEAAEYATRLDALEQRLAEVIHQTAATQDDAEARMSKLHEEVELLKAQLGALSKGNWAKSVAIRLANWLADPSNRKLLKSGSELAKQLVLPSGNSGPAA